MVILFSSVELISLFHPKASGVSREDAIEQVIQSVREFVGPVAAFKTAIVVPTLPKVCQNNHTASKLSLFFTFIIVAALIQNSSLTV